MSAPPGDRFRVLVVLGNYALNGQERANIEVYRALRDEGVAPLFATHASWGGEHIQPHLDRLGLPWAPIEYARHFTKRMSLRDALQNLGIARSASQALHQLADSFRPTHIHLANPHYALAALPVIQSIGAGVVYRMGDEPTVHHAFYRLLWRRGIIPRVDRFVCNSAYVQQTALASGVPESKTRVILSAPPERSVAASDLPPDLAAEASGDASPFAGRTVVFVGQLSEHKGVHLLIDAVLSRPDVRLLIAGRPPGNSPFASHQLERVLHADVGDRVRFLGYIEDIPGLLGLADVHAAPSIWEEPLANTVLEAKRAGVPSVVFPSGGLPEVVVEQGRDAMVCREKTAEALADGLAHYLDLDAEALADAGHAAKDSLRSIGSDSSTFRQRWLATLAETAPPSRPA